MYKQELIKTDIDAYLKLHEQKDMLRFLTAGSVDDGKSTLIGRLLYDSKMIYEDQLAAVLKDSAVHGTTDDDFDPALLTDGLKAEREQGITIDVAYRYFSTDKRNFIIADTPGHEQYTRNMATGASGCNLAVILIDARHGVMPQTKRHSFIASLLGIKHLIVCINKMDLVDYDEEVFERIKDDYTAFAAKLEVNDIYFLPMSALKGDNVVDRSENMPWFKGAPMLAYLEDVHIASDRNLIDLRFPVQYVLRPNLNFRGYCGTVASGVIRKGDEVMILPSRKTSKVKSIVTFEGEIDEAFPPMAVTVTLEDEVDVSRGDMIVHKHNLPKIERRFEAMVVWMGDEPMDINKPYLIKQSTKMVSTRIDNVRYRIDVNSMNKVESQPLNLNEIGRVVFTATTPLMYDAYAKNRSTGNLIIVDTMTNNTVAAGMIIEREDADNLPTKIADEKSEVETASSRESFVKAEERIERYGQKPATIWITGLTGSGKMKLSYALERRLFDMGATCTLLDGQTVRKGINRDLGFDSESRAEHLRRVAEISHILNLNGQITIAGFVSPSIEIRKQISEIIGEEMFIEIYADAPVEWCEENDTTGIYKKVRDGELKNVVGIDVPYEPSENPALHLKMDESSIEESIEKIVALLRERKIFPV
ncbi:MAG: bifunctional sulfate adenylyltransferase subunit 1/adenylylsulfate kinase [Chlamydiae bacterium]|nr:MAG: bifunctional sulfate adenylyltransferase subunit 1/adenylylsulfate kinase [Chlamydiota bacterium]